MSKPNINNAIVRILKDNGYLCQPVGAGFLVTHRYILTCAHVINNALGISEYTDEPPLSTIFLDFPLLTKHRPLSATVHKWYPIKEINSIGEFENICVLELSPKTALPREAYPIPLVVLEGNAFFDRSVQMFGFPEDKEDGNWLNGRLQGTIKNSWIPIESEGNQWGFTSNFSGTAVWDKCENAVAGMLINIHTNNADNSAYMIPVITLINAWAELEQQTRPPNPYRSLQALREGDSNYFFGHKDVILKLKNIIEKQSFIAILGASNSGKSSLVFAGLVPLFQGNWLVSQFRPKNQPINELSQSLVPLIYPKLSNPDQYDKSNSLARKLLHSDLNLSDVLTRVFEEKAHQGKRLLLIVDQFEEIYTLNSEPDLQSRFIEILLEAIQYPDFTLLITMQADFMGKAVANSAFAKVLNTYPHEILGPMNEAELKTAIEWPTKKCGIKLEEGLTDRILQDLGDTPDKLPLLAFTLTQLWEWQVRGWLTNDAYKAIGGINQALPPHTNELNANLSPNGLQQQAFVPLIEEANERTEETRQITTHNHVAGDKWDLVTQNVPLVVSRRNEEKTALVTGSNEKTGVENEEIGLETLNVLEIAHDTSIRHWQPLRDWMNEYHRVRFLQNHKCLMVPSWETANQDEEAERKGSRLEKESNCLQRHHEEIRGETRALIQASLSMQKKQAPLKRMVMKGLVFSLALSLGFGTLAWWSWNKWRQYIKIVKEQKQEACIARKEAIEKKNQAIHTQSLFLVDLARQEIEQKHPVEGMLLALEALPKDINQPNQRPYVSEAEVQLNKAVFEQRERLVMPTQSAVFHVGLSNDGNQIVTTGKEGDVRLWNAKEGKLLYILKGHTKDVYHADFSPDGKLLVTAGWDNTARLWQVATGKLLQVLIGHKDSIEYATFNPDGNLLATVSFDNTARLWQMTTGKLLKVLIGHKESIEHAAFSPNGELLATASNDHTAHLWQVSTGKLLKILTGHKDAVFHVAFSPNGKLLVTASNDNTARLWQVKTGKQLKTLSEHQNGIRHAAFSPNGKLLVTAGWDDTARLWLVKSGQLVKELNQHEDNVRYATFSPDGKLVVTVSDDNTARLWLAETGQLLNLLTGHTDDLNHAAFSPDGKLLVTASDDSTARLWQISNERLLKELNQHKDEIWHLAFSPDGKLIVTASNDNTARLWQVETGKELKVLSGHTDEVRHAAFSPDGKLLATASWDKTACLWQVSTGKRLNLFTGHEDKVRHVAFSPDGKLLITASEDNTARLWQVSTGQLHKVLNQHKDSVYHAAFSPDGKLVATASLDNIARLWRVSTGELFKELIGHQSHVLYTDFSPDGETLVTTSWDNTARLWQVSTGQLLKELIGHKDSVFHAAFNSDGKLLVTASWDNTARLWQVSTGQLLKELIGHKSFVMHAAFSPDGKSVATASKDNTARLWEVSTGQLRKTFIGHKSLVTRAVFSPDGKLVATASKDNTARLWRMLSTQALINHASHKVPRCLTPKQRRRFFLPESESEMLIKEGEALAREGDIKTALIKFKEAKALTPCFKFDPKAKVVTLLIKRGEELAQQGKIQTAVVSFSKALELDSRLQLNQPEDYARKLARLTALVQIENGFALAEQGEIERAIDIYQEAQQIETGLEISVDNWLRLCVLGNMRGQASKVKAACAEVTLLKAGRIKKGLALAVQGHIEKAVVIYQKAQRARLEISVDDWLNLCALGYIYGQPIKVKKACAKATAIKDSENIEQRLNRSIARVLAGNMQGAIEDIQWLLIKYVENEKVKILLHGWLEKLLRDENPFSREDLKELLFE